MDRYGLAPLEGAAGSEESIASRVIVPCQSPSSSRPRYPGASVLFYRVSEEFALQMKSWNKEETLKLIDTYKTHKLLWDPKSTNHFNKILKKEAWEAIGGEMGKSALECKTKVESLLSGLRREKMKLTKSLRSGKGSDNVYKSSWYAFDSMMFLWGKNNLKNKLNTLTRGRTREKTPEEVASPGETTSSQDPQSPATNSATNRIVPPTPINPSEVKTEGLEEHHLENAFETHEQSVETVHDESYYFGNFVASKLRLYDATTRTAIQSEIMNVFLSANSSLYYNGGGTSIPNASTSPS